MPRTAVFTLAVLAAALVSGPASPQARQSGLRVSEGQVPLYATVQDSGSRLVSNLTKEDFAIFEDGKEQPITFFSSDTAPFSAVIILDHSGSLYRYLAVVHSAAAEFVRRMLPGDLLRIGSFGDSIIDRIQINPPEFTSNVAELTDVLRVPVKGGGPSPVWIAVDQSISALSNQAARRVAVLWTDGYDEPLPTRGLPPPSIRDVVSRARASNTMVYAIGVKAERVVSGRSEFIEPHQDLRKLADDTGGGYFHFAAGTDDLSALFIRIAEELHAQYSIAFSAARRDGKVHNIQVRAKKPDLKVRARQTYLAASR